jgi:predicted permease
MKPALARLALRFYRFWAGGFPDDFQLAHGGDLVHLSQDLVGDSANLSWPAFTAFLFRLFADLAWRCVAEHAMALRLDLIHSTRMLWNSPGLAIAATISLGVGIGCCAISYEQIYNFYFRDTPGVGQAKSLLGFDESVPYADFEAFRDHSGQFQNLTAYLAPVPFLVTVDGKTQRVWGHVVAPNYFDVLQARLTMGSTFSNTGPQVIVSHRLWSSRLGANHASIGSPIQINGQAVTLAGVTAPEFLGASPMLAAADLWMPATTKAGIVPELGGTPAFRLIGRLQPGVALTSAEAALDTQARSWEQQRHDANRDRKERRVTLIPAGRLIPLSNRDRLAAAAFPAVMMGLLLWVACANVANLLIARAAGRQREIGVRLAMGASRWRLIRQLLTESLLLSLLGSIAGFFFAMWSNSSYEMMKPMLPDYTNIQFGSNLTGLWLSIGIGVLTGIFFGLAPALHATRCDIAPALKQGVSFRLEGFRWFSTRNMLVLQQVAGSLMLLLLTGFILLGLHRTTGGELGFSPQHVLRMSLDPVRQGYSPEAAHKLLDKVIEELRRQPGVRSAALSFAVPLEPFNSTRTSTSSFNRAKETRRIAFEQVGGEFFEAAGITIERGRGIVDDDESESRKVAVVNAAANQQLGELLELDDQKYEIIGVVKNVRSGLILDVARPHAYIPLPAAGFASPGLKGVALLVRTAPGVATETLARQVVRRLDPNLTLFDVVSMEDRVAEMMSLVRITLFMYGGIGVFSLLLAAVGLAGVTAYAVAQRSREIGIRIALGAQKSDVIGLVMREGAVLVITGTVAGMACAYACLRMMNAVLDVLAETTKTSISDPLLVVGAPLLLGGLTMLACYLPARRSLRIDPVTMLRQE